MRSSSAAKNLSATSPCVELGGSGAPLHFLHANGYPPGCYRPLLEQLTTEYQVFGMLLRPLWPEADPNVIRDWRPFSDDLRKFLKARAAAPVIGMGHSIGAVVTLRAALEGPGLFRALVLIDPVLLPMRRIVELRIVRALGIANRLNLRIERALRRRRHFDSLEQLFSGYRQRDVFRFFSDEQLRALVQGITRPAADGGYELVYSPEWEARIYETGMWNDQDIWNGLRSLELPTLIVRGADTDTFWAETARLVKRRNPRIKIVSVPEATHLLPMERPDEVVEATQEFIGLS